ncbi:MAG TPA: hypothetical protein VGA55_05105 [Bacteroidota bacterium]
MGFHLYLLYFNYEVARKKKQREPEYRLRVFSIQNSESKPVLVFVVETTKEFVNFHYELLLADERNGKDITLKILGIHTPRSVMPGVGPARGVRRYENLSGPVSVTMRNPDGEANTFRINVRKSSIELMDSPPHPFVRFSTETIELPE